MEHTAGTDKPASKNTFTALQQLPKDKDILDFVRRKLGENSSPEQNLILGEMLEMHRTSNGFDPHQLSKGRVKRFKARDFRRALYDINTAVEALIRSDEYRNMIRERKRFDSVLDTFHRIHDQLQGNRFSDGLTVSLNALKKDLVELEEYELLMALYRVSQGYYESGSGGEAVAGILEEFNQVRLMAELNSEHTLLALKTIQLVSEAERGNRNNEALVNLYDNLCKLLIRQSGTRAKYETLTRIIRVSAHLENKKHYMDPYLDYTRKHFEEIIQVLPEQARDLNSAMAMYLNRESLPVRVAYLNKAMNEATRDRSHNDLSLFKIIHAELCCDANDYNQAFTLLDEADYILSRSKNSGQQGEVILRSALTRFYICTYLALSGRSLPDPRLFSELIGKAASSGSKRTDLNITEMEMQALDHFVFGRFHEARSLFIKCVRARENQSSPVSFLLDGFFQELLRKTPDADLLQSRIRQLDQLKETFYSSLWVRILKEAIVKREVYGELVL